MPGPRRLTAAATEPTVAVMRFPTFADFLAAIAVPMTPLLVVRRIALDANIAAMQTACNATGVRLRAHGKMHKCPDIARLQLTAGAVGLCCQTVGEAEAFAAAGVPDLLVTAPVPPWGWPRLAALAAATHIAAVIDSRAQLAHAEAAATAAGVRLTVYVDVDPGLHRAGVAPADAPALAAAIAASPALRFGGVQYYAGNLQHVAGRAARAEANAAATAALAGLLDALRTAGLAPPQVTGGGTGTYALDLAGGVFTEIQAGSYALMDVEYTDCGGPVGDWPFVPALAVAATIVSARHRGHVTCDAGLKALSSDGPPARVIAGAPAGSRWRAMGDEHGAIIIPAGAEPPEEGTKVWLQPGHVDPTIALHDALFAASEEGRLERWPVAARRVTA